MGCFHSKGCFGKLPNSPLLLEKSSRVSSDEVGEDEDRLDQLNAGRDSDVGINRLSRVSKQFLPPEGSRKVRIPMGNYDIQYSYLSQRGYYPEALDKPNQDSFCIHTPFGVSPDDHFFGVFDGHGEFGAQCSQFVKKKLCENLLRDGRFQYDASEALHASYLATNLQLHADSLDDSMSGTTAITVLVRGRTMYVANAGDSRAVVAEKREDQIVAVDLSIDQTPYRNDELERVKECGARVLTLDQIEGLKDPNVPCWGTEEADDGDPPRLWVQNGMYPGTAFTRSIGDSVAESIGVVAAPEICVLELTPMYPFFVLASDGVFEFLSSQTVVDMVTKFKDPRDACAAIVAESYRLWLQYETRTDDITIIVAYINGLKDVETVQTSRRMGSESPFNMPAISRNPRSRHELSRARLRELENSLENGQTWVPPPTLHRKTWEEEAHIERALSDHFLFRKLTDSQCHVLLDCMQRVDVKPGDVVVQQGGEGDCFYVVGSGEFEVLAVQEEDGKQVNKVLHTYTSEKLSSFGELALMYNKPLQSSVRAVTTGTLWALKRDDFRGVLMSEFSNLSYLKLLRTVVLFSRLTILQLSRIAESLTEVSFADGQVIVNEDEQLCSLYMVRKGQVKLSYNDDLVSPDVKIFITHDDMQEHDKEDGRHAVHIGEGDHFGEWALIGKQLVSLKAVAIGDVTCLVISKENFDSMVGHLFKLPHNDETMKDFSTLHQESDASKGGALSTKSQPSDLEWKTVVHVTDWSEIGSLHSKGVDKIRSYKRFSIKKVRDHGKEVEVLKEKDLITSLGCSALVPPVLSTCKDQSFVGIIFDCHILCPLAYILHTPLDEVSARFFAASAVKALEELHQKPILYRGISSEVLMLDRAGRLQMVDFRFAKKLDGGRTLTICGIADSLSPEIVLGRGHGLSADWWALGILIYFMLRTEMPFGSWRENKLEQFANIAKGKLVLPSTFSTEVIDLITKLLEVDETLRLGSNGAESVKQHPWFASIDWNIIADGTFPVPEEIVSRVKIYAENHVDDVPVFQTSDPLQDKADHDVPEWIGDW